MASVNFFCWSVDLKRSRPTCEWPDADWTRKENKVGPQLFSQHIFVSTFCCWRKSAYKNVSKKSADFFSYRDEVIAIVFTFLQPVNGVAPRVSQGNGCKWQVCCLHFPELYLLKHQMGLLKWLRALPLLIHLKAYYRCKWICLSIINVSR